MRRMPLVRCLPLLLAWIVLVHKHVAEGFYLPGVAPQDFRKKDNIELKVNKLTSVTNQLPFEYYSLPFCRPEKIRHTAENLGEVLRGDRIENSLYQIQMRVDEQCKVLCRIPALTAEQAQAFSNRIDDDYRVNMILDNLPVAMVKMRKSDKSDVLIKSYERGYPVGFKALAGGLKGLLPNGMEAASKHTDFKFFLHNHLRFTLLYHKDEQTDLSRVVGFEVEPFSVQHTYEGKWDDAHPTLDTCNPGRMISVTHNLPPQPVTEGVEVIFTYDVRFMASDVKWATRWDTYLMMQDDQIHWFSIINSLMIVIFLSGMVAMIMLRTLARDISKYNQLDVAGEEGEETGWKLVHGDVFRAPAHASLLCTHIGTGIQLFGMTLVTMVFAMLGLLSPANRGALGTAMLMMFVLMGSVGGYYAGRMYKSFRGEEWKHMTLLTALLFPGICFAIFFVLDLLIWGQKSSGAIPFGTLFALCFLWFGISLPLVFVGSYFGFRKAPLEDPVRTNKIPRQIPEQPWYMNPLLTCLVGGVLPFGAVFIELFFILTSMWLQQFYYLFGILALVFVILVVTCAEISIVLCYFQLCSEDYHWWWRAYFTSGASALYLLLYSAFYFYSKLTIHKIVPLLMYFGYMAIVSYGFFCLTGAIGFCACFLFVRAIYSSVKID